METKPSGNTPAKSQEAASRIKQEPALKDPSSRQSFIKDLTLITASPNISSKERQQLLKKASETFAAQLPEAKIMLASDLTGQLADSADSKDRVKALLTIFDSLKIIQNGGASEANKAALSELLDNFAKAHGIKTLDPDPNYDAGKRSFLAKATRLAAAGITLAGLSSIPLAFSQFSTQSKSEPKPASSDRKTKPLIAPTSQPKTIPLSGVNVKANNPNEKPKETLKEPVPKTEMIGFRVDDIESLRALPDNIGIIRIAGNGTKVTRKENGEFVLNEPTNPKLEEMMKIAQEKDLKVVFVYNPNWFPGINNSDKLTGANENLVRQEIRNSLSAILKYNNVILEIGNEPDENKPNSPVVFWKGPIESYAQFYKMTAEEAEKIYAQKGVSNPTILLAAFAYPEKHEKELASLAAELKNIDFSSAKYPIAIHAYDPESLRWMIENYPRIFGKKTRLFLTETNKPLPPNAQPNDNIEAVDNVKSILDIVLKNNIPALFHKFSIHKKTLDKGTGLHYDLSPDDPQFKTIIDAAQVVLARKKKN